MCSPGGVRASPMLQRCFPGASVVKNLPAKAGDLGSIPGLGRSTAGGNGSPLQYSCLENPMDRGAWWGYSPMGSKRDMTEQLYNNNSQLTMLDSFRWTAKRLSHTYTCIHSPPNSPPPRLPHDIELSSLCWTAGPCWFSMLNTAVCPCPSQTP